MPKISVIVPIYKVEEYLPRCVDSILAQTFTDFELWLVDDGSPDKCGEICDEYAKRDSRIRVIHKQNGGLSDARNAALDKATGEYISFIDSDDWVAPDFLESLYGALTRNNADLAICNIMKVVGDSEPVPDYKPADSETVLTGDKMFDTLYRPSACNKLYPSWIFKEVRYPVGRFYEDVFVYHDILAQVKRLVYTGKDSYFYYIRKGSIIHSGHGIKTYSDSVDSYVLRARKLDELNQPFHANFTRLRLYMQFGKAYHWFAGKPQHAGELKRLKAIFEKEYPAMMSFKGTPFKQKIRLWLMHISPRLHEMVYGKKKK